MVRMNVADKLAKLAREQSKAVAKQIAITATIKQ